VECELETSIRAVIVKISRKWLKWHFYYLTGFSGVPHLIHFSPMGGCSVLHFLLGQTTVSLSPQFLQ
jgi:hypothetical protein